MGYEVSPKSQPTSVVAKNKTQTESKNNGNGKDSLAVMSKRLGAFTIQEDVKEGEPEDEEGLTLYPYHRLITASTDPAPEIDATKREVQISLSLPLPLLFPPLPLLFPFGSLLVHNISFAGTIQTYLSSAEFREKFGMAKEAFTKLPKWKQNRLKMALLLF